MMAKYFVAIGTAAALLISGSARSYEVQTHENLTIHAYNRSILANPERSPLRAFGIEDQSEARFVTRAVDDTWPLDDLESRVVTPREVVALGAHQEDIPTQDGRFLNHFFDPQQGGIGLSVPSANPASPRWVLEDAGQIAAQNDSLRDALVFHRRALDLPQQAERDANLTRLLEIIGRSVHHLQDMSQPAHVRNDAHPPWDVDIYEAYTNKLFGPRAALGAMPRSSPWPSGELVVRLDIFNEALKFWSNAGQGVAEFTSKNFVSRDTDFIVTGNGFAAQHPHGSPAPTLNTYVSIADLDIANNLPIPPTARIHFLGNQVTDLYPSAHTMPNERASTWSLFTPDLSTLTGSMVLTQNRLNFARNYEFLLPRAIAYSAGLIDYYFRGRLELEAISSAGGVTTITIRNASAPGFALGEGLTGFRLFYDAVDGTRHEIGDVQQLDDPGAELAFDATRRLSFPTPADVDSRKQAQYVLMFDGMIGTETGVTALAFGTAPSGLRVVPHYTTTDGAPGARHLVWNGGGWTATVAPEYQAGTIDWKGHQAEDVLTWGDGPRYQGGGGPVYMSGRVLTSGVAGYSVAGASIRYIDGQRVLNVAVTTNNTIRIYSRPFAARYDNDEVWSEANPFGWRLVYSGNHGERYTGFFFNASGNEGQYITRATGLPRPDRRVKITLSGYTGSAVDFPAVATITRTERLLRTSNESLSITHGVCSTHPDDSDGFIVRDPEDSCARVEFGGTESRVDHVTIREQYADRTLFCVDYRGDQEVFCELQPPSSELVESRLIETLVQQHLRRTNGTCGGTDSNDTDRTETTTFVQGRARVMRIGNLEIPWTMDDDTESSADFWGGEFFSPRNYSGNFTSHRTRTVRTTRLIQFDARHDFAVYEDSLREYVNDFTSNFISSVSSSSNLIQNAARHDRVVLQFGGASQLLFEDDTSERTETPHSGGGGDGDYPTDGLTHNGVQACVPLSPTDQSTVTTLADELAATQLFSSMSSSGSYAIDRSGRLALSQRITELQPPYQSQGYRNVLTGGDLPTLMPGTPSDEGYRYSIGLIR